MREAVASFHRVYLPDAETAWARTVVPSFTIDCTLLAPISVDDTALKASMSLPTLQGGSRETGENTAARCQVNMTAFLKYNIVCLLHAPRTGRGLKSLGEGTQQRCLCLYTQI